MLNELETILDLEMCQKPWSSIVDVAVRCGFTRDPFDRLIVAHAMLNNNFIITKDENLTANYPNCIW